MPDFGELPFVFSGPHLDRASLHRSRHDLAQSSDPETRYVYVPVCGESNVLLADAVTPLLLDSLSARPLLAQSLCAVLLGHFQDQLHVALGLPEDCTLPVTKFTLTDLRPQFSSLDHARLALLGYARAMVHWHLQNRYCGKCGSPTHSQLAGHELHCKQCGNILYPRVNPAIIVLVTHGDRCLLGRKSASNRYSTLAGFVEPGESLEASVRREVHEETNIRIAAMRYRGSQPWPYPASIMLGFRALAENTDIRCNDAELTDARWFARNEIVDGLRRADLMLSAPQSIAYALLRDWFDEDGSSLDALSSPDDSASRT